MEILPNEILVYVFSHLSWDDMLTSFWSLNIRFNSLICSTFTIDNNGLHMARGLSCKKYSSILFSLILNSSSLLSFIERIHFNGTNSSADNFCYEWLFNNEHIPRFPNLKSLVLKRCASIEPVVQSLLYLIEHQLVELTLTFDDHIFHRHRYTRSLLSMVSNAEQEKMIKKQEKMIEKLICQFFSGQCQLKSLRLDISNELHGGFIHQCLANSNLFSRLNTNQIQSSCRTLTYLHIRLNAIYILESLIEHLPNLEQLFIESTSTLEFRSEQSKENWFDKMAKLKSFTLKTFIFGDTGFVSLKWLLNNLNYIEKLQLHLKSEVDLGIRSRNLLRSLIDANFIRQYCLPDTIVNLIDFDFYICSECQLSLNDIEKVTNSFRIHPFFLDHQWTDVKCLFDPIMSCQHLFSSFTRTSQLSNNRINYPFLFNWSYIDHIFTHPYPSLHFCLQYFNEFHRHVSSIKVYKRRQQPFQELDLAISLEFLVQIKQYKMIDIPFRNITKIQFGTCFTRENAKSWRPIKQNPTREKLLAYLISFTVQLKYLLVERFEWLLYMVQYTSDELRINALSTVQYAEFCLPSCHRGYNEVTHVGKHLVPFLSTYMPHLQILRLWRLDDFPWTSIRPDFKRPPANLISHRKWFKSLQTSEAIAQHTAIFEEDLCQLIDKLKALTFLDIYGQTQYENVESYRSMAQARFLDSRVDVEISRFRLWL